jgi:hypothetical protein
MSENFINTDYIVSGSITSPNPCTISGSVHKEEPKTFSPGGGEISVKVDISEQDFCKFMWCVYGDQIKRTLTPHRIIHNRKTDETIVIWKDGTKTKVKLMEGEKSSPYTAYTAALAKRIYGSNTQVNKIVSMTIEPEKRSKS